MSLFTSFSIIYLYIFESSLFTSSNISSTETAQKTEFWAKNSCILVLQDQLTEKKYNVNLKTVNLLGATFMWVRGDS